MSDDILIPAIKTCRDCGIEKSNDAFHIHRRNSDNLHSYCKECRAKHGQSWRQRNPHYAHKWKLRTRYGMSYEDYSKQLEYQNNSCGICLKPFIDFPEVDHNHSTNEWRGLLCHACNVFIGFAGENPKVLENAIGYIGTNGIRYNK